MLKLNRLMLALLLCFIGTVTQAQLSVGGLPPSFKSKETGTVLKSSFQKATLVSPEREKLYSEDLMMRKDGDVGPPRVAVILPVNYTPENSGEWVRLESGELIWRLTINAPNAIALALTYSDFRLPAGSKLFIYSANKKHVIGAYTEANNPVGYKEFATELVAGDELILEYVSPMQANQDAGKMGKEQLDSDKLNYQADPPVISISGVAYAYNNAFIHLSPDFYDTKVPLMALPDDNNDQSASCMVNINCAEGANWQDEKRGVAATLQKIEMSFFICSGTLVNNTARNMDPYFLMAFHCSNNNGTIATDADLNQWLFYFHWESVDCLRNSPRNEYKTMTGASRLVAIPLDGGSDGLLLKLKTAVPSDWNVYYNGWDRRNVPATSGVGIHHPKGDVKKISTFTTTAQNSGKVVFEGSQISAENSGWNVLYAATANGHGVTQSGSSGSPLFNQNKRVVGTLTGGLASCTNLTGSNVYGKLWYHWDQSADNKLWMKPYLDPENTGEEFIDGIYLSGKVAVQFDVNKKEIWASESVSFLNMSNGAETSEWEFPGGTPSTYTGKTPPAIKYNSVGSYTVKLTINKGTADEKTLEKTGCINVKIKDIVTKEIKREEAVSPIPLGTQTGYAKLYTASLYHKEELDWVNGDLIQIDWNCGRATIGDANKRSVKVYFKHVPANLPNLSTGYSTYGSVVAGAQLVASYTNIEIPEGYVRFPFNVGDKKFTYDNDSSLLVITEVEFVANSVGGNHDPFCATSSNPGHVRTWQATAANLITATSTSGSSSARPNIRLTNYLGNHNPVAAFEIQCAGEYLLKEYFDKTSIPTDWTIEKPGASMNQWKLDSPREALAFNNIEPGSSLQSLRIVYDPEKEINTWLKSPEVKITDPTTVVEFYLYYGGAYLDGGCANFYISEDNGVSWTQEWTTGSTPNSSLSSNWRKQRFTLNEYAGKTVRFAWQYKGKNGDDMYLDGIKVLVPGEKITTFEGETVSFLDRSVGPPVLWNWTLPGGSLINSSLQNIYVSYMTPGSYSPSLRITNNLGDHTKIMENGVVVKSRIPNTQFYSVSKNSFTTYPHYGQFLSLSGGEVQFTDTSHYYPKSYEWVLPGATPTASTNATITVNYPAGVNSYNATLKATNSAGTKDLTRAGYVKVGGTEAIWNVPYGDPCASVITGSKDLKTFYTTGSSPFWSKVAEYFVGSAPGEISKIMLKIYKVGTMNLTVNVYSDNKGKPGKIITSVPLPNASIVDGDYSTVTFPTPVGVDSSFFVVVSDFLEYKSGQKACVASSSIKQKGHECTSYIFLDGDWHPLTYINPELTISMNIVPTLTYTESAQLTSKADFKCKDVDSSLNPISFTTTGKGWWAEADEWIALSDTIGAISGGAGSLTFTCKNNTTPQMRKGTITVYPGGIPFKINVTQGGSYPANFTAKYDDNVKKVKLIWGNEQFSPVSTDLFDGAEGHTDFAIESRMPNHWDYIDADGLPTWAISNVTFPGMSSKISFMVFNPSSTSPTLSGMAAYKPHTGNKYFACFAANPGPNDDWMISPLLGFSSSFTFSFWAKTALTDYGKERFNVYYSTTGKEKADFTNKVNTGQYIETPDTWTRFTYTIPAEAKYVAINCVSNDAFIFMVDDIFIGTGTPPTASAPVAMSMVDVNAEINQMSIERNMSSSILVNKMNAASADNTTTYKIFRNGVLLTEGLKTEIYYDENTTVGETPCYTITATYEGDSFFESVKSPDQCVFVKSPIVVTVDNKQVTENMPLPAFSSATTGKLLETDAYSDIVDISYSCNATIASRAGSYPIVATVTNKLTDKYVVSVVNGVLTVNSSPSVISRQPVGGLVCKGNSYTFSVEGSGLEVTYQWQKQTNGIWHNIDGANTAGYTINAVNPNDAGNYRALITGRTNVATSNIAILKVALPKEDILVFEWNDVPTVNCNPATNGGYQFISFQWYKNGTLVNGATKPYIQAESGVTYDCEMTTNDGRVFRLCNYTYQLNRAQQLMIYPNPASPSDQITVSQGNVEKGSVINIYNINGVLVKSIVSTNDKETRMRINELTSGVYTIQVVGPKGIKQTSKLLVK